MSPFVRAVLRNELELVGLCFCVFVCFLLKPVFLMVRFCVLVYVFLVAASFVVNPLTGPTRLQNDTWRGE